MTSDSMQYRAEEDGASPDVPEEFIESLEAFTGGPDFFLLFRLSPLLFPAIRFARQEK